MSSTDRLNPSYYTLPNGVECKDVAQYMSYNIGCAIKYLWRHGRKHEDGISDIDKAIEDLQKARTYLEFEIAKLKSDLLPLAPPERPKLSEKEFLKASLENCDFLQCEREASCDSIVAHFGCSPEFLDYYKCWDINPHQKHRKIFKALHSAIYVYQILEWGADNNTLRLTSKDKKS